jgi:hypothetical protein
MRLFPDLYALLLGKLISLVNLEVTGMAKRRNSIVVGFDSLSFSISKLIRVSCHDCAVNPTTVLAWGFV